MRVYVFIILQMVNQHQKHQMYRGVKHVHL